MDHSERYYQLAQQGRDAFLRSAAPAALVRRRSGDGSGITDTETRQIESLDEDGIATIAAPLSALTTPTGDLAVYPLTKKPGAPFAEMITVGRTANNDVVLKDITVSRFHSFFRQRGSKWIVCDAGSKNGTFLDGTRLEARKERTLVSGAVVRIGDVACTFYTADDLYDALQQG